MIKIEELKKYGVVKENISFSQITTIRIGGPIAYYVLPRNIVELKGLIKYLNYNRHDYKILGKGSNTLASDDRYEGVVISLLKMEDYYIDDELIYCEAGVSAVRLALLALDNSLTGLEFIHSIPGSMGGLIYMNAGAYKSSISDVLETVFVLKNDEIVAMKASELDFSYRNSIFKRHRDWIIIAAIFRLKKGDKKEIKELMDNRKKRREETQPLNYPNCGSCFKNPESCFSWQLIDAVGLRGYQKNGITISEKHPNFIVNKGNGKAKDFLDVVKMIKEKIYYKYNVKMELEVELFGVEDEQKN